MTPDLLEDEGYQRFLADVAKGCRAGDRPCPGCCAGGVCDGPGENDDDPWLDEPADAGDLAAFASALTDAVDLCPEDPKGDE